MKFKREAVLFSALIIFLFLLGLFLIKANSLLLWDENIFLGNARSHISLSNFTEDFKFPLLEYLIAFVWFFIGESVFSARILSLLLYLLSVFIFYLIMKRIFNNDKKSLLFSIFFAIAPVMLYWSFRVYADILSMVLSLSAVYFLIRYEQSKAKPIFIILTGLFSSMAFLARFALGIFAFSVFIYLILRKDKKGLLLFALSSFIFVLPWLIYNWISYGNILWDLMYYQSGMNLWTTREPIFKEIVNICINLGFLIVFLIPGIFCFVRRVINEIKRKKIEIFSFFFIYLSLSLVYYTFFINLKDERYVLIMLPFFLILSFLGLNYLEKRISLFNRKLRIICSIFIVLLLFSSAIFFINFSINKFYNTSECQKENALFYSMNYIKNNSLLSEEDTFISNYWPYYAYYFNARGYAIWDSNLEDKIKEYNPGLVILKEHDGTSYNETSFNKSSSIILLQNFSDKCNNKIRVYAINSSTSSLS